MAAKPGFALVPRGSLPIILLALTILTPRPAWTQASFYQGKTITIVQGRDPGRHRRYAGESHDAFFAKIHSRKPLDRQ